MKQPVAGSVERLGATLVEAGLPRLPSRVFAQLMCDEDGRMTAAELASALSSSPAGISQAVAFLTQVQMIRREREPGSRRDVFVVLDDAWHDAMLRQNSIYSRLRAVFVQAQEAVGGPGTAAGRRLGLSAEFLAFVETEMAELEARWEAHKATLRTA
ncbi:MAG: MarR family transcriptional regulator [Kineosporiaceae bacterium]|nr:MarR family transcriptional regulator [Kineosporiaceae bacterium]